MNITQKKISFVGKTYNRFDLLTDYPFYVDRPCMRVALQKSHNNKLSIPKWRALIYTPIIEQIRCHGLMGKQAGKFGGCIDSASCRIGRLLNSPLISLGGYI